MQSGRTSSHSTFPFCNRSGYYPEDRVGEWYVDPRKFQRSRWIATLEFLEQMVPLELELSRPDFQREHVWGDDDSGCVEAVPTAIGLVPNSVKICRDCGDRFRSIPKAIQLRMPPVSVGLPQEHLLSEQSLAPQRGESLTVQILRMQTPESHRESWLYASRRGLRCAESYWPDILLPWDIAEPA